MQNNCRIVAESCRLTEGVRPLWQKNSDNFSQRGQTPLKKSSDNSQNTVLKKLKKVLTYRQHCSIVFIVPVNGTDDATVAQLVEYDLAKVGVAGSNPVCRSDMSIWI